MTLITNFNLYLSVVICMLSITLESFKSQKDFKLNFLSISETIIVLKPTY